MFSRESARILSEGRHFRHQEKPLNKPGQVETDQCRFGVSKHAHAHRQKGIETNKYVAAASAPLRSHHSPLFNFVGYAFFVT